MLIARYAAWRKGFRHQSERPSLARMCIRPSQASHGTALGIATIVGIPTLRFSNRAKTVPEAIHNHKSVSGVNFRPRSLSKPSVAFSQCMRALEHSDTEARLGPSKRVNASHTYVRTSVHAHQHVHAYVCMLQCWFRNLRNTTQPLRDVSKTRCVNP